MRLTGPPRLARALVSRAGPPVISAVLLLVVWEVTVRGLAVPVWLLPPPSLVLTAGWHERHQLTMAAWSTLTTAMAGFLASAILGVLGAIVLSLSRWIERGLLPHAMVFQTVPIVSIAPLLVLWLGAGPRAVSAAAFIVSVFPVLTNTLAGLHSVDPALSDLFRLYGASRTARLIKLEIPHAGPSIATGLKIACGLAVVGAIVGEFVAGISEGQPGLGLVIMATYRLLQTDLLFAALIASSGLGLVMLATISLLIELVRRKFGPRSSTA